MTDAPDRIWATEPSAEFYEDQLWFDTPGGENVTEYLRRDSAVLARDPMVLALIEVEAEGEPQAMTDPQKTVAETVARLRDHARQNTTLGGVVHDERCLEAADLLEALAARLAEVDAERDRLSDMVVSENDRFRGLVNVETARAEALAARLAEVTLWNKATNEENYRYQERARAAEVRVAELEALVGAAKNAAMYLNSGFINCQRCGEEVPTKHTDAEYELNTTLARIEGKNE